MTEQRRRRRRRPAATRRATAQPRASGKMDRLIAAAKAAVPKAENKQFAMFYVFALEQAARGQKSFLQFIGQLKQAPVPIEEFIDSDQFLKATDLGLWPEVRKAIIEIVESPGHEWWRGERFGAYTELMAGGATGTGKSEMGKVLTAYALHILGCLDRPQTYYGLPSATQILLPIFAAKPKVTKNVLYEPLRTYITQMPWFQRNMRFDKYVESEMVFEEQNIRVVPVGADVDTILGEAVIGGMMDECNFMQIVQNSKKAEAKIGRSARYDQAEDIYQKVTRRKRGRFNRIGPNLAWLCCMSSTLYPGEFTDVREKEVRDGDAEHVYIYRKAQYEAAPKERFEGQDVFYVCVHGDAGGTIEIKEKGESLPKTASVYEVPDSYLTDFRRDPEGSVRDVIGLSTRSLSPFISKPSAVEEAMELHDMLNLPAIVLKQNVYLPLDGMPKVETGHYCKDPSRPRYVHIDLSHTSDRCGIAMLRFDGMSSQSRQGTVEERLPTCTVELAMSIEPDRLDGIDIAEVRGWVSRLKKDFGYPIRVVSYDGWNSLESRQQWKRAGMPTAFISVDRTDAPYKQFRDALYDGRIALPRNDLLAEELRDLEHDKQKGKVDHLPNGSKDIADAVCGAFNLMLNRSESWRVVDSDGRGDMPNRYQGPRSELGQRA